MRVEVRFRKCTYEFDYGQIEMIHTDGSWREMDNKHQKYSVLSADQIIFRSTMSPGSELIRLIVLNAECIKLRS